MMVSISGRVMHEFMGGISADFLRHNEAGHLAPYRRWAVSLSRFRGRKNAMCPDLVPFVPMDLAPTCHAPFSSEHLGLPHAASVS